MTHPRPVRLAQGTWLVFAAWVSLAIAALGVTAAAQPAPNVTFVTSAPSPALVRVGDTATLEVRATADAPATAEDLVLGALPDADGLQLRIAPRLVRKLDGETIVSTWRLYATPSRAGPLTIPPLVLLTADTRIETKPRVLQAVLDQSGNRFVRAELRPSKTVGFVGEDLTLELRISVDADLLREGRLLSSSRRRLDVPLEVHVAWPDAIDSDTTPSADPAGPSLSLNGQWARADEVLDEPAGVLGPTAFRTLILRRTLALGEQSPSGGLVELPSAIVRFRWAETFREDLFSGRVAVDPQDGIVYSPRVQIESLALPSPTRPWPDGASDVLETRLVIPSGSGGPSTDTLSIDVEAEPRVVRLGETIRVEVTLRSTDPTRLGTRLRRSVGAASPPALTFRGYTVLGSLWLPGSEDRREQEAGFVFDIVPNRRSLQAIPPVRLAYFVPDPDRPGRGSFRVAESAAIPITIEGEVAEDVGTLGSEGNSGSEMDSGSEGNSGSGMNSGHDSNREGTPSTIDTWRTHAFATPLDRHALLASPSLTPSTWHVILSLILPAAVALGLRRWLRRRARELMNPALRRDRLAATRFRRRLRAADPSGPGDALLGYIADRAAHGEAWVATHPGLADTLRELFGHTSSASAIASAQELEHEVRIHVDSRYQRGADRKHEPMDRARAETWVRTLEAARSKVQPRRGDGDGETQRRITAVRVSATAVVFSIALSVACSDRRDDRQRSAALDRALDLATRAAQAAQTQEDWGACARDLEAALDLTEHTLGDGRLPTTWLLQLGWAEWQREREVHALAALLAAQRRQPWDASIRAQCAHVERELGLVDPPELESMVDTIRHVWNRLVPDSWSLYWLLTALYALGLLGAAIFEPIRGRTGRAPSRALVVSRTFVLGCGLGLVLLGWPRIGARSAEGLVAHQVVLRERPQQAAAVLNAQPLQQGDPVTLTAWGSPRWSQIAAAETPTGQAWIPAPSIARIR